MIAGMSTCSCVKLLRVCLAATACALCGCLEVERTITLNPDGSGTVYISYGIKPADLADLKEVMRRQLAEEGLDPEQAATPFDLDEQEVREGFEDYREDGIRLLDLKREEANGRRYLRVTIAFESLEGLSHTEFLSDGDLRLERTPEGHYAFSQSGPQGDAAAEFEGAQQMMEELMKGFRATVRVVVPGPILESNADRVDGRSAEWAFDVARDPKALERAQKLDMRVVFGGEGLSIPEFRGAGAP